MEHGVVAVLAVDTSEDVFSGVDGSEAFFAGGYPYPLRRRGNERREDWLSLSSFVVVVL